MSDLPLLNRPFNRASLSAKAMLLYSPISQLTPDWKASSSPATAKAMGIHHLHRARLYHHTMRATLGMLSGSTMGSGSYSMHAGVQATCKARTSHILQNLLHSTSP